ncbi:MAG: hypothetical protein QOJ89_408 [bacterium]
MRQARGRAFWASAGAALALVGAGAALLPGAYEEPLRVRALGRDAPVNRGALVPADISSNNSPSLVRSPRDPRRLAIANRIDTPRYSCALHVSSDSGASWTQTPLPAPRGETECYAPDAVFDAAGTLYVSFVTLRGGGHVPDAAWMVTSGDGGRTLSAPRRMLGKLVFQVRLAADPATAGRVYVTWLQGAEVGIYRFSRLGAPIRTMRSDDGARTWSRPVQTSSPTRARVLAPSPAVGPDGALYVLYLDLGDDRIDYEGGHGGRGGPPYPGPWRLVLARSRDRGATWGESVVESRIVPTERVIAFIPPFPALAVDPAGGRLYAAFHDGRLGDADVWLWTLGRGARRWSAPVRVNDTVRRDGTAQYLPKLAVAPDGRLDVLYYDRRRDRGRNEANEVSLQSSTDGGERFTGRVVLSSRAFDAQVGFGVERGLPDLGSRLGLLSDDARALAVWPDTRAGTRVSLKQDIARRVVAFSGPEGLGSAATAVLRAGGGAALVAGLSLLALVGLRRGPVAAPARRRLQQLRRRLRDRRSAPDRTAAAHLADRDAADEDGEAEAQ